MRLEDMKQHFEDANQAVYFARELEHVKAQTYDIQYADLKYREVFPVDTSIPEGAETWTFYTFDQIGMAKIISDYGGDLPRSDVGGRKTSGFLKRFGTSFGYTIDDIAAGQMTGMPLDARKADSSRRSIEESFNTIAWFGDDDANLVGLMNHPNIPTADVVDGASTTPEWTTKTPTEILTDINTALNTVFTLTKQKEKCNTILLPTAQWSLIMTTPMSVDNPTTIAQMVVKNSPYIMSLEDIIPVNELAGAGTAGVDVMVVYNRNPNKVQFAISQDVTFHEVQKHNLEFMTPVTGKTGGLIVYYPLSLSISEKI